MPSTHSDSHRGPFVACVVLLAMAGLAASGGCVPVMTGLVASAPNRFNPLAGKETGAPSLDSLLGVDRQYWVPVGPPAAMLAVSVLDPRPADHPPRGTVLVLHGLGARAAWMHGTARRFSEAGYRVVLVDLRGHGRSSGKWLTYGVREAEDLSQVLDALAGRGLIDGPLGVFGISYGATTAIHLAARDPRVAAVVAVAPFSNVRDEVPQYLQTALPGFSWMIPRATVQQAIDEAGRIGRFDPDVDHALAAIQRTRAPILLLHGEDDWLVSAEHGRRLHDAAPANSEFILLPDLGHTTIWLDAQGEVSTRARLWFDRHLVERRDSAAARRP